MAGAKGFKIADAYVDIDVNFDPSKLRAALRKGFVGNSAMMRTMGRRIGTVFADGMAAAIRRSRGELIDALIAAIIPMEPYAYMLGRMIGESFTDGLVGAINGRAIRTRIMRALRDGLPTNLIDGLNGDIENAFNTRISTTINEAGTRSGRTFSQRFLRVVRTILLGALGTTLATIIGASLVKLLPPIAVLGNAIGSALMGGLALLPAAIFTAVGAFAALKLAVKGTGDAIKAGWEGDAEAFKEATKGMAASAVMFVQEVVKLKKPLLDLKRVVQEEFFSGLAPLLRDMAKNLIPTLTHGLYGFAEGWNIAARAVFAYLAGQRAVGLIKELLAGTSEAFKILAGAARPFLDILLMLGSTGSQYLPGIAMWLRNAAEAFADMLSDMQTSGRLSEWFERMFAAAKQLWDLLVQIGGAAAAFWNAAADAGGGFLNTATQVFGALNAWLSSLEGQQTLAAIFSGASAVIGALLPIVQTLLGALGPIAEAVLPALTKGLGLLQLAAAPVAEALAAVFEALAPILPLLGTTLGSILIVAAELLKGLAMALAPIINLLSEMAQGVLPTLVGAFRTLVEAGLRIAAPLFQLLAEALVQLVPPMTQFANALAEMVVPLIAQLTPLMTQLAEAIAPLIPQFVQIAITVMEAVLPALLQLVQMFTEQYITVLQQIIPMVPELMDALLELANAGLELFQALSPLIPVFVELVAWMIENGGATTAITMVFQALIGVVRILTGVVQIVIGVINALKSAWDVAKGAASGFAAMVTGAVTSALNTLKNLANDVRGVFAGAGDWLVGAGRAMMQGLANGITSMLGWAVDKARSAAMAVVNGFKSALGISSPSKVMAKEVGRWIPPGIAKGIEDKTPMLEDTLRAIVPELARSVGAGGAGPVTTFAPGSVTLDVSRVQSFSQLEALLVGLQQTARAYSAATPGPVNA